MKTYQKKLLQENMNVSRNIWIREETQKEISWYWRFAKNEYSRLMLKICKNRHSVIIFAKNEYSRIGLKIYKERMVKNDAEDWIRNLNWRAKFEGYHIQIDMCLNDHLSKRTCI